MTKLRELREFRDWSQAELARRAGLHASTLSLLESGRLRAYPAQVQKLARALRLPVKEVEQALGEASRPSRRPSRGKR